MWMTSNGYSRTFAGVATAGVVALAAGGFTPAPAMALPAALPSAPVSVPVELTALGGDSSLMDIIGALTGLGWIIPILDHPENPLFPFVISLEALGELFVVIPLTVVIGAPLLLITEGWEGIQEAVTMLSTVVDDVTSVFNNLVDWYATHNWFTGALLDAGSSAAVDLSGLGDVFPTGGVDGVFTADGFDSVLTAAGFDAVLADFGLGDLIS